MIAPRAVQIRQCIATLSDQGKQAVSMQRVFAVLGAAGPGEKPYVQNFINKMIQRGELTRLTPGIFDYVPARTAKLDAPTAKTRRMWRLIRTETVGWSAADIASMARVSVVAVRVYCKKLAADGYVKRCGKNGRTHLYRTAPKALRRREPPRLSSLDAWREARAAASVLVRALDKQNPATERDRIVAACRSILAHFEQQEEQEP